MSGEWNGTLIRRGGAPAAARQSWDVELANHTGDEWTYGTTGTRVYGDYWLLGDLVRIAGQVRLGEEAVVETGFITMNVPVPIAGSAGYAYPVGPVELVDQNGGGGGGPIIKLGQLIYIPGFVSGKLLIIVDNAEIMDGNPISDTDPFTWDGATHDELTFSGWYRAA